MPLLKAVHSGSENSVGLGAPGLAGKNYSNTNNNRSCLQKSMIEGNHKSKTFQRSFADISNCADRVKSISMACDTLKSTNATNPEKKLLKDNDINPNKFFSPFSGPDFRPDFKEIEDYDDVLPPSCQLSEETIKKFVHFWNAQKSLDDDFLKFPSPKLEPEFLPTIKMNGFKLESPAKLKPVIENDCVFDLPPPLWDF